MQEETNCSLIRYPGSVFEWKDRTIIELIDKRMQFRMVKFILSLGGQFVIRLLQ